MINLYFEIVLPNYRDNPVAEIWYGDNMVCEIMKENNFFEIVFFEKNYHFEIEFDSFMKIILEAKESLSKKFDEYYN